MWNSIVSILEIGFSIEKLHRDNYVFHRENTSHPKVIYKGAKFKKKKERKKKRNPKNQILLYHDKNIVMQDFGYCTT